MGTLFQVLCEFAEFDAVCQFGQIGKVGLGSTDQRWIWANDSDLRHDFGLQPWKITGGTLLLDC